MFNSTSEFCQLIAEVLGRQKLQSTAPPVQPKPVLLATTLLDVNMLYSILYLIAIFNSLRGAYSTQL